MLNRVRLNWDAFGVCASSLCLVHCVVLPLLVALLLPQRGVECCALERVGDAEASGAATKSLRCCANEECCAVAGSKRATT